MSDPLATIPLSAIRVFEAAARLGSFTRAAQELGMTQAAVSWQVKALEQRLDQPLFRRLPREVQLTTAGERLARAATDAITGLRSAVSDITDAGDGVLSITALHTFANQWLAPRLGGFQIAQPGVAVRLDTQARIVDLRREGVDVAIRSGEGRWPEMEAVSLFPAGMTPLGTPQAVARLGRSPRPQDLVGAERIGTVEEWTHWFEAAGVAPPQDASDATPRITADAQALEIAAAMSNHGFALASPVLFGADIAAGRLVQPFEIYWTEGRHYWLVYPRDRRRTRKIAAFREWLVGRVAADPAAVRLNATRLAPGSLATAG